MMKNIFFFLLTIVFANKVFAANKSDLDYCSGVDAWAATKVISEEVRKNALLDGTQAMTQLLSTRPVTGNNMPINAGTWGPVYLQVIKVSIPYKTTSKNRKVELLVSSFISAQECSMSEPSYINLTQLNQLK